MTTRKSLHFHKFVSSTEVFFHCLSMQRFVSRRSFSSAGLASSSLDDVRAERAAPLGRRTLLSPADMTRPSEHIMRVSGVVCLSAVTIRGLAHDWLDAEGLDVRLGETWVKKLLYKKLAKCVKEMHSRKGQARILLRVVASIHASEATLAAARAAVPHIVLCFIPPRNSSFLQPCDVAVFRSLHPGASEHHA